MGGHRMRAAACRITPSKLQWVLAFVVLYPFATKAAVIEIAPDGVVTVYDGPVAGKPALVNPVLAPAGRIIATPSNLRPDFLRAAAESGLSPDLIAAVAFVESSFKNG